VQAVVIFWIFFVLLSSQEELKKTLSINDNRNAKHGRSGSARAEKTKDLEELAKPLGLVAR
jgi:hypothetical protein